jgi:hypothetical protein
MKILKKDVELDEVLSCYDRENQGSASFAWARDYLSRKSHESGDRWTLVLLSREDILNIMLPDHRHPAENPNVLIPKAGMTVSAAALRVRDVTQEIGLCWENIHSHKDRDFSQLHIFLQYQDGGLMIASCCRSTSFHADPFEGSSRTSPTSRIFGSKRRLRNLPNTMSSMNWANAAARFLIRRPIQLSLRTSAFCEIACYRDGESRSQSLFNRSK